MVFQFETLIGKGKLIIWEYGNVRIWKYSQKVDVEWSKCESR